MLRRKRRSKLSVNLINGGRIYSDAGIDPSSIIVGAGEGLRKLNARNRSEAAEIVRRTGVDLL